MIRYVSSSIGQSSEFQIHRLGVRVPPDVLGDLMDIDAHVLKYPKSVRITFLAMMYRYYNRLLELSEEYPTYVDTSDGWRVMIHAGCKDGFTLGGWIDAIWNSL